MSSSTHDGQKSGSGIVRDLCLVTLQIQHEAQAIGCVGVVVDDENAAWRRHLGGFHRLGDILREFLGEGQAQSEHAAFLEAVGRFERAAMELG